MKITKDNVKQVIDYIKAGGSVVVKAADLANAWQFSMKDDQRVECRNVDTGYACHYQLTSLEHDAMWGYELVSVSGIPVDMSHYAPQTTRHKHYNLIMQWAADPANTRIQFKNNGNWVDLDEPTWLSRVEYRIKPKIILVRQVIYDEGDGSNRHFISQNFYATEDEFAAQTNMNFISWYEPTAKEIEVE